MPNAVDDGVFELNSSFMRDPNRILFAGMITQVKGADVLVRAMARVVQSRPAAFLEIVGDPYFPTYRREENPVRKLVRELGLTRHVRFMGPLDSPDLARRISESALVVLPSRRESFGSVLIEALACGIPVVSTRCGGPEAIVNDTVGRLAAANDPEDLAGSLLDVLANPDRFDPVALNAYAVERYGLTAVGKQLEELYAEVTEG
jgi:glycosyltransferase involved in cell wall biosynthesis